MLKPLDRGNSVEEAKHVNAKTSTKTGTVKVKASEGFRFGGSKVAATRAVALA